MVRMFFWSSPGNHDQGNIAFCSAERAQPLRIDGPSEQDWLTETARNLIGTDKLWTGGNKADPNTGWNWFEWPSFPYVNWDSSQPDKEKDFITMNTANGKWQTHEENEVRSGQIFDRYLTRL